MEGQTGFQPPKSSGFNDSGFEKVSSGFNDSGFEKVSSGLQDSDITQTGFHPDNSGFNDSGSKKSKSEFSQTGFQPDNGFSQGGFQKVSSGFTQGGFQQPEEITIKSAYLEEIKQAAKEANAAVQKLYNLLGRKGFHPGADE